MCPADNSSSLPLIETTCGGCSCLCDDILVHLKENGDVELPDLDCTLARQYFSRPRPSTRNHRVHGETVPLPNAIRAASDLLRGSNRTLILGMEYTCTETQQAAIALADRIGGVVASDSLPGAAEAEQRIGKVSCSLGEVRHRADLVVLWGGDPLKTHPRLLSKHVLQTGGEWIKDRSERRCVLIGSEANSTRQLVDKFIPLPVEDYLVALHFFRSQVTNLPLAPSFQPADDWAELANQMLEASYGVIIFSGEFASGKSSVAEYSALYELVRALNQRTRFRCIDLPSAFNSVGAKQVSGWQTGYPSGIDFSAGFPEYDPIALCGQETLQRQRWSAIVSLAGDACPWLDESIPRIVLGNAEQQATNSSIQFDVAEHGFDATGTAFRLDGIPIPIPNLYPIREPRCEQVIAEILKQL